MRGHHRLAELFANRERISGRTRQYSVSVESDGIGDSKRYLSSPVSTRALRVIDSRCSRRGGIPFEDSELENIGQSLTDDDVSSGTRNELERDGTPIDRVESDFVSQQAVSDHRVDRLDASLEMPGDGDRPKRSGE